MTRCLEHIPAVFDPLYHQSLRDTIVEHYQRIDSGQLPGEEIGFVPSASSFPLKSLCTVATVLRALAPRVVARLNALLGDDIRVDLDIAWVRRQFAPVARPPPAAPHYWHQDGAWGFDFLGARSAGEVLPTKTLWIALDDCGEKAPGLEFICEPPRGLLSLEALEPAQLEKRQPQTAHWYPNLLAGDGLLFSGEYLHRTHVHASMKYNRHSIELRFIDGRRIPQRLAQHQFLQLV
ncbi:MAG: ectoine hydroxylase-related dioxygenase (phytanoyl-CoA dioxygenase family) [Halieaceae bacterium]|jgi:ectoine hydroxylase-related dioxygenase (phytanoyl-CoA dioxygenase family)